MTTFDDTDLFSEAFHDFRSVGSSRRRPALVTPVVMVAAALLVAAGFLWARGGPLLADTSVDASTLLPQFAAEQTSQDRLSSDELGDLRVDPRTTRFLTETSTGRTTPRVGRRRALRGDRPARRAVGAQLRAAHGDRAGRRGRDPARRRVVGARPAPPRAAGVRRAPTSS